MNADVTVHAYDTTPVAARTAPEGRDVDVRIGDVRIWLPREVALRLGRAIVAAAEGVS